LNKLPCLKRIAIFNFSQNQNFNYTIQQQYSSNTWIRQRKVKAEQRNFKKLLFERGFGVLGFWGFGVELMEKNINTVKLKLREIKN
jgi:hypothetical protein